MVSLEYTLYTHTPSDDCHCWDSWFWQIGRPRPWVLYYDVAAPPQNPIVDASSVRMACPWLTYCTHQVRNSTTVTTHDRSHGSAALGENLRKRWSHRFSGLRLDRSCTLSHSLYTLLSGTLQCSTILHGTYSRYSLIQSAYSVVNTDKPNNHFCIRQIHMVGDSGSWLCHVIGLTGEAKGPMRFPWIFHTHSKPQTLKRTRGFIDGYRLVDEFGGLAPVDIWYSGPGLVSRFI